MAYESKPTDIQPSKANASNLPHLPQTQTAAPINLTTKTLQRTQSFVSSLTSALLSTLLPPQSRMHVHTLTLPTSHTIRTTLLTTLRAHPRRTIFLLLGLVAEYQQPGFIPRPTELSTLLASAPCATLLICLGVALEEWTGKETWEGVWENAVGRYWGDEREGGGEESTMAIEADVNGQKTESSVVLERQKQMPTSASDEGTAQSTTPTHPPPQAEGEVQALTSPDSLSSSPPSFQPAHATAAYPPPAIGSSSLPRTLLPPDLVLSPLTPSKIHTSGLLGESPMPVAAKFSSKHFSGTSFARRNRVLGKMGVWSGYERVALSEWIDERKEDKIDEGDDEEGED
jgi:hypothetical protein